MWDTLRRDSKGGAGPTSTDVGASRGRGNSFATANELSVTESRHSRKVERIRFFSVDVWGVRNACILLFMRKKYLWLILFLLLILGAGWYFSGLVSHSEAAIISPKSGDTVGPNFPITVAAPDTWFQNGATTVIVTKSDGSILMTGGVTVEKIGTTKNGLASFKVMINLMGPGDDRGPYAGPATITIEPQLQNVLEQIGDIEASSDLDTKLTNNTKRSPQELQIRLILKDRP